MLSASEIRNIKFTKSMGGYKQEEVDVTLDKIEADYSQYERVIKDYQQKIDALNKQVEDYKSSQSSIQNVLLSAQKLADQIVDEAKTKSQEIVNNAESSISLITAREKELSTTFELKAQERKEKLQKELDEMERTAKLKSESIIEATKDCTKREQVLFDKLKMEVAAFKESVTSKFRDQLSIIKELPDAVPMDPNKISELVAAKYDRVPDPSDYIKQDKTDDDTTDISEQEEAPKQSTSGFEIKNDKI